MHWQGAQHFFYGIDQPHKHLFVTPPGPRGAAASTTGTTRSSAGTTTGSKGSTTASWTTLPSRYGSWARTSGAPSRAGRCQRPTGRSTTCTAGRSSAATRHLPAAAHLHQRAPGRLRADAAHADQQDRAAPLPDRASSRGHAGGRAHLPEVLGLASTRTIPTGSSSSRTWARMSLCRRHGRASAKYPRAYPSGSLPGAGSRPPAGRSIPSASKPWKPWHYLRRGNHPAGGAGRHQRISGGDPVDRQPVQRRAPHLPGDHQPRPGEGVAGETFAEYIPNHVCSSKIVLHKVFHNAEYPSHLLLPVMSLG